MTKRKYYYIGRREDGDYELGTSRKDWDSHGFDGCICEFCPDEWERVTKLRLQREECVRVRVAVERHPRKQTVIERWDDWGWDKYALYYRWDYLKGFYPEDWESVTGLKLKSGESAPIKITVERA